MKPKATVGSWYHAKGTLMLMPEAPVNEDGDLVLCQYKIRGPMKGPRIDTESKSSLVQLAANHPLNLCVAAFHGTHVFLPLLGGENVGHCSRLEDLLP